MRPMSVCDLDTAYLYYQHGRTWGFWRSTSQVMALSAALLTAAPSGLLIWHHAGPNFGDCEDAWQAVAP